MATQETRLLTSVRVVGRSVHGLLSALPHVTQQISLLLNHSHGWTLESASQADLPHLLSFLEPLEWRDVSTAFRRARFEYAVQQAAKAGQLEVLKWWMLHYLPGRDRTKLVFRLAALHGHLPIIQWLYEQQLLSPHVPGADFVRCDQPNVIYWMAKQDINISLEISLDLAARNGDLAFLEWIHARRHLQDRYSVICPPNIDSADMNVLQWLATRYGQLHFTNLGTLAVHEGNLKAVKWLIETFNWNRRSDRDARVEWLTIFAAHFSHLEIMKYLYSVFNAPRFNRWHHLPMVAARCGNLEMMKWLHSIPFYTTTQSMYQAAESGHLEIINWLHEHHIEGCTTAAMDDAAANNHLHVVKWLHENRTEGCTADAMDMAAANGHSEMVVWLHENRSEGCTTEAMDGAATGGHLNLVQWLQAHRSEGCTTHAMDGAASNGELQIIEWLHANRSEGCTVEAINEAAIYGHLDVLKFLVSSYDLNCDDIDEFDQIVANGHFEVLEWILKNGTNHEMKLRLTQALQESC